MSFDLVSHIRVINTSEGQYCIDNCFLSCGKVKVIVVANLYFKLFAQSKSMLKIPFFDY